MVDHYGPENLGNVDLCIVSYVGEDGRFDVSPLSVTSDDKFAFFLGDFDERRDVLDLLRVGQSANYVLGVTWITLKRSPACKGFLDRKSVV